MALVRRAGPGVGDEPPVRILFAPREPPPLGPDVAGDLPRYREWVARRQAARLESPARADGPELTVLLVLDRPRPEGLAGCLDALAAQTSARWHLSVAVVGDLDDATEAVLGHRLAGLGPRRARVRTLPPGSGDGTALAAALEQSATPGCVVLGQHDRLVPDALALLSSALVDADVAYADEDRVDAAGALSDPLLKPDWSPELALSWCYVGLPLALRAAPVVAAGGVADVPDGDAVHDLLLRVTERTDRVAHVAEVLCHRDGTASPAGPGAPTAALARRGEPASVSPGPLAGTWAVRRRLHLPVTVSAIVPFRDSTRLLRACAESLLATAGGVGLELVLVDNGSAAPETRTLVERLAGRHGVVVIDDPRPFNWAALNNAAVDAAAGEVLLFVNDDVHARTPGWLEALAAQALRPEVGAAGARLLYPGGRLQHAGMVVGLGGAAGHVLAGLAADQPGYMGMAALTRDVSAVTGACLATRREVFDRIGRFDERLGLDANDVDYCLRARRRGLRVVFEPAAELVHHESPTRGTSGSTADIARFVERWHELLDSGDPFLNRHLTRADCSAALAAAQDAQRWRRWRADLEIDGSKEGGGAGE